MSRHSFVIYDNWVTILTIMNNEDAGELIKAIGRYALYGIESEISDPDIALAFGQIKQQLDADRAKYERKKERMDALNRERATKSNTKTGTKSSTKTVGVTDTVTVTDTVLSKDNIYIPEKGKRHKYGEYGHVLLSDKQYQKLCNDYSEAEVAEMIRILDEAIQIKGYKYKDYNLVLRGWVRKEYEKQNQTGQTEWERRWNFETGGS